MVDAWPGILVRVLCDGPRPFTAGFEIEAGRVARAAPILRKHLCGLTEARARAVIRAKGWRAFIVREGQPLRRTEPE